MEVGGYGLPYNVTEAVFVAVECDHAYYMHVRVRMRVFLSI